jgi:hypothetical protein
LNISPPGTELRIQGTFRHRSEASGNAIDFFIVKDSNDQLSETMVAGFDLFQSSKNKPLDAEEERALKSAKVYEQDRNVIVSSCFKDEKKKLRWLIEDFSLAQEVSIKKPKDGLGGGSCTDFEFKNLTAYLTYRHFKKAWSYGARGLERNVKEEVCVAAPNEQNKGSMVCPQYLKELIQRKDEEGLMKLLAGWIIAPNDLQNFVSKSVFTNFNPALQVLIVKHLPNEEIVRALCDSYEDLVKRMDCFLKNSNRFN